MENIKEIINKRDWSKGRFSKHEFQVFGYHLADALGDLKHKALYIKLAKSESRGRLEEALGFVKSSQARSRPKLFMWKLKQLRDEKEAVAEEKGISRC